MYECHKLFQVLPVKFGSRIVQQQGRAARALTLLNLELRKHQSRRDEFLLTARDMILCRPPVNQNDNIGAVWSRLRRAVAAITHAILL
jgi:hypothetical protein